MTPIVVLVDFTENSGNAARYAADMAAAIGAGLRLVHFLEFPSTTGTGPMPYSVLQDIRDSGLSALQLLADELKTRTGGKIHISTDQETGDMTQRIFQFCKKEQPYMVVRGAPSREDQPIRPLPFPLLTIPPAISFHPIRSILLACDLEDINMGIEVPVSFLRQLSDLFQAHFDLLHVTTKTEQISRLDLADWKIGPEHHYPRLDVIKAASVSEGIQEYLRSHETDWLVIFPKKSGLFHLHKSLSRNILLNCPLPVMNLHE